MMSNYFNEWWSGLIKQSAIDRITPEYLAWEEIESAEAELAEKDKRIEDLERLLTPLAGSYHKILPEHVEAAREYFSARRAGIH